MHIFLFMTYELLFNGLVLRAHTVLNSHFEYLTCGFRSTRVFEITLTETTSEMMMCIQQSPR